MNSLNRDISTPVRKVAIGDRRLRMEQHAGVMVTTLLMIALFVASPMIAFIDKQTAADGGFEIIVDIEVRFGRELAGDRVGQHGVPPLTPVTVTITATISGGQANDATLIDYFPNSWMMIDANGGSVSAHDENHDKIEWDIGTASGPVSRSYVIKSPELTTPPTNYYFRSGLTYDGGSLVSDDWMVTVAGTTDPGSTPGDNLSHSPALIVRGRDKQIYNTVLRPDIDEEAEVIIGDEDNPFSFKPKITFTRWNGESHLSLEYDGLNGAPTFANNELRVSGAREEFYIAPYDEQTIKFGLIFKERPSTNTFQFRLIGWEEFDFFYQPPLSEDNPTGYHYEDYGNGQGEWRNYRPPDVVGSYAVYHKDKRNHIVGQTNYKTGKFGHFYRPKFIDADGNWVWGDLEIKNGVYTVTIPQYFLDSAVYPIKANDTYGSTSQGASETAWSANYSSNFAVSGTMPANGTVTQVNIWLRYFQADQNLVANYYGNDGNKSSAGDVSGTFGNVNNIQNDYGYAISGDAESSGDKLYTAFAFDTSAPYIASDSTPSIANMWRDSTWQSFPITLSATRDTDVSSQNQASTYITYTPSAVSAWNQVESWTGAVTSPVNWNQVESWSGTVTAPANWNQVESWAGTVTSPANWNQVESWSGTVTSPTNWNQVESWAGTVVSPANWSQIESWTGTVNAYAADTTALSAPSLTAPTDNASTNDSTPTFGWEPVSGAASYTLQYATDSEFTQNLTTASSTTTDYIPATLTDETWYWRVRAVNAADNAGSWSSTWSFTVDTIAPAVTLSSSLGATGTVTGWALTTANNSIKIEGSVSDATGVTLKINGEVVSVVGGSFSKTASLVTGTNTFTMTVTDSAGNTMTQTLKVTRTETGAPSTTPATQPELAGFVAAVGGMVIVLMVLVKVVIGKKS